MVIQYNVSAVPGRIEHAERLERKLPGSILRVDRAMTGGSWKNYRAALTDFPRCDWIVSVDDDAELCNGFTGNVRNALRTCPGDIVSFFINRKSSRAARYALDNGYCWLRTYKTLHGVAWAVRSEHCQEIVEFAESRVPKGHKSGDKRLLCWALSTGRGCFVTIPNLVDHRTDMPSAMGKQTRFPSRSACFEFTPQAEWTSRTVADTGRPETLLLALQKSGFLMPEEDRQRFSRPPQRQL